MLSNKISLTGVKPTGTPHFGNLLGAFYPVVRMSDEAKKTYVFIADLHALNAVKDREFIHKNTYEIAATYLALGINLEKAILFRQSDIPEVYQLATLLMNVTPKGLMNRAHAYKASVDKNLAKGEDADAGINMGLYTYPILMAADILLYNSDVVPVGQDQKQHVEFARDIAGSFNYIYGKDLLTSPEPIIPEDAATVPGLDGRKMSKSYNNYIPIFAPEKELRKLIMKIITDSKLPEEPKDPEESTIFHLYRAFANEAQTEELRQRFIKGGLGYGEAKQILFEAINEKIAPAREKYYDLMAHTEQIDAILADGAAKAREEAKKTLARVLKAMLG
ncbi:MAG: tryptophan--tRNA ligase [Alphaproteobacteria bacterium]|nr:tryptophan--tRNA ligase [Alphaproteobacteria bacterium]